MHFNKNFQWNEEKNKLLQQERNISFEAIVTAIENGHLLDIIPHPKKEYKHQRVFVLDMEGYIVLAPFVEDEHKTFLKTAFPSRKAAKSYKRNSS